MGRNILSRGKELIKNTAIVAVGKVCTKFLSFFLLPFYTAVLSTEEYGIVDLFNTYVSLLLPIIVFQIEDALFRFLVDVRQKDEEKEKSDIYGIFLCIVSECNIYYCIFSDFYAAFDSIWILSVVECDCQYIFRRFATIGKRAWK